MDRIRLSEVCNPKQWKTIPTSELLEEGYPVYGANGVIGYYSEYNHENPVVAITCRGATCGSINITVPKAYVTGNAMCLDDVRDDIELDYLYYCLRQYDFNNVISGSAQPQITRQGLDKVYINIWNHEEQVEIIERLKQIEKVIIIRKNELQYLDDLIKARFVELFGGIHDERFELKTLPEIVVKDKNSIKRGPFGGALKKEDFVETGYLVYEQRHAIHNDFEYEKYYITKEKYEDMIGFKVVPGDLIISCSGVTLGRIAEVPKEAKEGIINQALLKLSLNQTVMKNTFFIHQFRSEEIQEILFGFSRGSGIPNMPSMNEVKAVKFICPPIELQEQFTVFVKQTEKSKLEVHKSLNEMQLLMDSLMQQYFG